MVGNKRNAGGSITRARLYYPANFTDDQPGREASDVAHDIDLDTNGTIKLQGGTLTAPEIGLNRPSVSRAIPVDVRHAPRGYLPQEFNEPRRYAGAGEFGRHNHD